MGIKSDLQKKRKSFYVRKNTLKKSITYENAQVRL